MQMVQMGIRRVKSLPYLCSPPAQFPSLEASSFASFLYELPESLGIYKQVCVFAYTGKYIHTTHIICLSIQLSRITHLKKIIITFK